MYCTESNHESLGRIHVEYQSVRLHDGTKISLLPGPIRNWSQVSTQLVDRGCALLARPGSAGSLNLWQTSNSMDRHALWSLDVIILLFLSSFVVCPCQDHLSHYFYSWSWNSVRELYKYIMQKLWIRNEQLTFNVARQPRRTIYVKRNQSCFVLEIR